MLYKPAAGVIPETFRHGFPLIVFPNAICYVKHLIYSAWRTLAARVRIIRAQGFVNFRIHRGHVNDDDYRATTAPRRGHDNAQIR